MSEVWATIDDWPDYQVSSLGRVRYAVYGYGFVLPVSIHPYQGYHSVRFPVLGANGRPRWAYVHQLVIEAFIGSRPQGLIVLHGPAGVSDNSVENLSYGTHRQNRLDFLYRDSKDFVVEFNPKPCVRSDGVIFESRSATARSVGTTATCSAISHAIKFNKYYKGYRWQALISPASPS